MLILNEEKYAKTVYDGTNHDVKSIMEKIRYVTRYFLHTLQKNDEDNYTCTVKWLKEHHDNFNESNYSNLISDAIKKAHKYPFYDIKSIQITQSELLKIASLNDLRAEKVLFVLLCMAKQQSVPHGFTNGLVKYSLSEVCKLARISVPADDREYILYNIVQSGLLGYPKKNNTQCLIIKDLIDDSENKNVVLELNETHCTELAYEYLMWKNGGQGYARCECCEKVIKQYKSHPRRFCRECTEIVGDVPDGMRARLCKDCYKPIYVDKRNMTKVRCEDCQSIRNINTKSERNKKYYSSHKN